MLSDIITPSKSGELVIPEGPVFDMEQAFLQVLGDTVLGYGARGYNTEGDVLTQTIDGRDLNEMWRDFQTALGAWNQARSTIVQALTFPVGFPVEDVPQITGDDFEEASEFGEPKGMRGGNFFSMAYDFKWYDLAQRFTWKYLAEATAGQVDSLNNMALEADSRLVFSRVLKAIFNNATRTADIRNQSFNVYPFYNGDSTVPPAYKNIVHTSGHTHYLVTGGVGTDSATLEPGDVAGATGSMEDHLRHHGYGRQAGATMILMVNPAQLSVIRTWRVATGAPYDFIPAAGQPPWLLPTVTGGVVTPQGSGIPTTVGGLEVAGRYGPWLVVEEDYIPAGYLFGFSTGGENNATNPVGFREHANAGLRGLRLVKGRDNDYPLIDSFYQRGFGTGVRHRGAGVVMRLATIATGYAVPAEYA